MPQAFDPVRKRRFWVEFNLEFETDLVAYQMPAKAQALYLSTTANSLIIGYLLGLADRVQPTLAAMVAWMENRPEPDVHLFDEEWEHWRDGWYALYAWRRTLGVCRWLCGIDGAEDALGGALEAERQAWQQATPEDAARDFYLRRESLPEHLVVALAANDPLGGLSLREAAGITTISADHPRLLFLGQWACLHLHAGPGRDADFIKRGVEHLSRLVWPTLVSAGRLTELALWMKVFASDTGQVATPEEAMALSYVLMPEVERPDFAKSIFGGD
jgi:hypothetical protein